LLLELQSYQWLARRWPEARPALREVFQTVGELDALASVGRWRADLPIWCQPDLEAERPHLEIDEGVHPLLDDPVPASLSLTARGCLVTGVNMSGKSTLLRTLGINALLAQTIFTCPARRYRATPLRIISSMRVRDDILEGRSRYLAEAERLLALVRRADRSEATLCLIDELLSGTNASERLAASRAILDYLADRGLLVVAATHDLELTEALRERYDTYYFGDKLTGDDMRFDYRLRPGVATTRNAVRLLERLGYPAAIVAQAREPRQ
jgi:DNA mismatch repair ATPase MutS